jgi:hypothetical protein
MSRSSSHARFARAWPVVLALGLPMLAALTLGADSNWDLRNYHLYAPHAWWTGRDVIDVAPAQQQSWHNPLLDLPMYALARSGLPMRAATAWLLVPAAIALWSVLRLHAMLSPAPPRPLAQAVLALLVLTGAAFGSTLGLSMNDGFVAAGMLLALRLALDAPAAGPPWRGWLLAGLVAGATAGLKLTAVFYCVALAVAALPGGGARARLGRLGALAAGGIAGLALTYGWWAWRLHEAFGNPVFPYFNQVFQSASALPWSYEDARFKPQGIVDALSAPMRLLRNNSAFSELRLRDPRLLLGLVGSAWLAWRTRGIAPALRARYLALALFVFVGTALWLAQSGIYRYAIGLEALGALALVLLVQGDGHPARARRTAVLLVLALLLVSMDTRRPHWGREGSPTGFAGWHLPPLGDGAVVVTATGDPLAHVALGLPGNVPLLGLANNFMQPERCTALQARASARLRTQAGPIWLLEDPTQPPGPPRATLATHYGLVAAGECLDAGSPVGPARLCRLHRAGLPRAPCDQVRNTTYRAPR